jgi:hypothetical protein
MRNTLTSIVALGLALGAPAVAFGQDTDIERFRDAGFETVTAAPMVEVARVEGEDGDHYYIIGGMGTGAGMDTGMDTMGAAATDTTMPTDTTAPTDTATADTATDTAPGTEPMTDTAETAPGTEPMTDTAAVTGTATATPAVGMQSLEEQLDMAGIENYEILDDVVVGRMMAGTDTLYIVYGIDGGGDSD